MAEKTNTKVPRETHQCSSAAAARKPKAASVSKPPKVTPEQMLADELNQVKKLQGSRYISITTEDIDAILDANARLIEQLVQPSKIKDSYEYVDKFAKLQRNLVLISRLADQPK